jgi:UDP-2,3-diacylglucosamine pyrophosphatase LpxH
MICTMADRGMLIFVSDLHLTDTLKGPAIAKEILFQRFWERINASRGDGEVVIAFVGDLFDIVRSPYWLEGSTRPYQQTSAAQAQTVTEICERIIAREERFMAAIRSKVEAGELRVDYILGNHDRLLNDAPEARRAVWRALTGRDTDEKMPTERIYRQHGVIAHHGHTTDFICHSTEGPAPIGDAIGLELIVRYPGELRREVGETLDELDDIDDVRPIFAVPSWVRAYASTRKHILKPATKVWRQVVEEFLDNSFTKEWEKAHRRIGFSEAKKLQMLLQMSTGRVLRKTSDQKLVAIYRMLQQFFDGRFAQNAARRLESSGDERLRYVVNGHSHFSSMTPLGILNGLPAAYFNTGTWRTVHQMGRLTSGRPGFLPYDAMTYLVFFPEADALGRDYEWWTGAMVPREHHDDTRAIELP